MCMMEILREWRRLGLLRDIDVQFARFIARIAGAGADPLLLLGAALAGNAAGAGHICLELKELAGETGMPAWRPSGQPATDEDEENLGVTPAAIPSVALPPCAEWAAKLEAATACVAAVNAAPAKATAPQTPPRPLVLDKQHNRLYLFRFWRYEQRLAAGLLAHAQKQPLVELGETLGNRIKEYFPDDGTPGPKLQRLAAFAGLRSSLAIVTGGPGTGKTYIVARLLALMLEGKPELAVKIAAPTGKAAKRIMESIRASVAKLNIKDELKQRLPSDAFTLHRLLGAMGEGLVFRHDSDNPLEADVVIVDEASMIDLPMAARLLDALRPDARLVLLGDMHQLASVEPGNVFGDICSAVPKPNSFSNAMLEDCRKTGLDPDKELAAGPGGLGDCLVRLTHNYRLKPASSIAELSEKIVIGSAEGTLELLRQNKDDSLRWIRVKPEASDEHEKKLAEILDKYAKHYAGLCEKMKNFDVKEETHREKLDNIFRLYARLRILCALRGGPFGIRRINAKIEELLGAAAGSSREWYPGRPVIITRNNYSLGLFNGDVGIAEQAKSGKIRVWFEPASSGGEYRSFAPQLLPDFEVAHALSVHKSQGSEFEEVVLLLTPKPSPVLTRELLYTAVTRAKQKAIIVGTEAVIRDTVKTPGARKSGLRDALEGAAG